MIADPMRGQINLEIDGEDHLLHYDMRATRALLRALKVKNLTQVVGKAGDFTIDEQFALLVEGLRSGDVPDSTEEWLEKHLAGPQLPAYAARVAVFLNREMFEEMAATKERLRGVVGDDAEDPTTTGA